MIALTEEQRRALYAQPTRPVEVIDPATARTYVLLEREQFERVRALLEAVAAPESNDAARVSPGMLRSQQAFWRDLPELLPLASRKRQWVAYHGDERVGFGETSTELCQECLRRGFQNDEFFIGMLQPQEAPPWEVFEVERSLFEVNDDATPDAQAP